MKVNELRSALEARGLNTKGLKPELAARLQEAFDQDEEEDEKQKIRETDEEDDEDDETMKVVLLVNKFSKKNNLNFTKYF